MLNSPILADRLRVAVGRLARLLRQQSLGGLTPSQASVLATLDRHGEMTMGVLAQHESVARPSATGIVSKLVARGLIERKPGEDDLRCAIVSITPEGVAVLESRRQEKTAFLVQKIELLTSEEQATLERAVVILEQVYENS